MGLFKRIGDIISANFGEMAESWEDPEKMLRQAIKEMDASIKESTQETAKVLANEKKLGKELAHNDNQMRQWQDRAEKAVESGDDELARKALQRKKEHQTLSEALQGQMSSAQEASQTLRMQLDAMKAKLAEAKRNLASLSARNKAANVRKKVYSSMDAESNIALDNSAFDKFERMREKVEQAEAEAEALAELQGIDTGSADSSAGSCSSNLDEDIEAQLAALKQKKSS